MLSDGKAPCLQFRAGDVVDHTYRQAINAAAPAASRHP